MSSTRLQLVLDPIRPDSLVRIWHGTEPRLRLAVRSLPFLLNIMLFLPPFPHLGSSLRPNVVPPVEVALPEGV